MNRRAFTKAIVALIAWRGFFSSVKAQQSSTPKRIGVLLVGQAPGSKEVEQFRRGLRDAGQVEGRDIVIDWKWADADYNQVPILAAELVARKVDVLVADSTVAAQMLKRATSNIPIVMALVADPVGSGLVTNLAHPDGNVTGLSMMHTDLTAKRLQILKETLPRLSRLAVLWNSDTPPQTQAILQIKATAPSLSIELSFVAARTPEEIGLAFPAINRARPQALYVMDDAMFYAHRKLLLAHASRAKLPVFGSYMGGLLSYGTNLGDLFYRSAGYVDKILRGAKPGDLPIEQPTKFDLVVNLKNARELGITIPEAIRVRADEVIR